MPLRRKRSSPLRVAVFGDATTLIPVITPPLIAKNCQIIPVDNTLSPAAFRELQVDFCIIDLTEPALAAHVFMRRLPAELPIIAVVTGTGREFEFAEIFDVLTLPIDAVRLGEDIDYLRMAARCGDPAPLPPTDTELEEFSEFISKKCGLHFDRRNRKTLERGIQRRMRVVAAPSVAAYFTYLQDFLESRREFKKLVALLTIGETSFFRFDPHFAALIEKVIPELIKVHQESRRLRIWSAGCSTGEEAYSLAITLLQHFPQLADWDITILGTDISHQSLAAARQGHYQDRTLRNVTPKLLAGWFIQDGSGWTVNERLRSLTRFAFLNLQSETYPSPKNGTTECDLIFCRNVMIYFRPETVRAVVSRLRRALRPGGYLFLGHAETLGAGFLDFVRCQHHGGTYYRAGGQENVDSATNEFSHQDENKNKPQFILFGKINDNSLLVPSVPQDEKEKSGIILADKVNNKTSSPKNTTIITPPTPTADQLLDQGFSLADQGRLDEALALCRQVLRADDLSPRAYFLRGLILDQQGQSALAAEDFQRVILLDLKAVMAHYHLANVYRRSGRKAEALRSLQTALRLLTRMGDEETIADAKDWTVSGLQERCRTELKQLEK
ncbi:MAG: tetratricopeptide repeat protein [Desulfuromonadales bacterium]|nr:tetratricopeptide repeat protein [Desulfuromonadales bacterium]